MNARSGKTLYDKIWESHLVHEAPGEASVIYIDRHLVHEVTSAQAFEGLREHGRKARRPELTLAVADHNVPDNRPQQGHLRSGIRQSAWPRWKTMRASSASNISA